MGDRRPPKWTINGNLVNCSKMSSHGRHFLQLCLARPKKPLFRQRFRFVEMFTKPDRPLSSLAKSPFRSPFPFPSKSPSSIPAFFPRNRRRCSVPPSLCGNRRVRRKLPKSSFVVVVVSLCRSATVNFSQLRPPRLLRGLARPLARPVGRGLQGSLNLLRPPPLLDQPTMRPSSTARRYHTLRRRAVGRNGPILDHRVPV